MPGLLYCLQPSMLTGFLIIEVSEPLPSSPMASLISSNPCGSSPIKSQPSEGPGVLMCRSYHGESNCQLMLIDVIEAKRWGMMVC